MSKTDILVNIQTIQDLLSEHFNMYLCLVDEMGQENCYHQDYLWNVLIISLKNSKCQSCTRTT